MQSQAESGILSKLGYRAQGPFVKTQDPGNNSFEVRRYDEPSSAVRKYKNKEFYLLPPPLFSLGGAGYNRPA